MNVYTHFVIKMQRLSSSTGVNLCFSVDLLRAHAPIPSADPWAQRPAMPVPSSPLPHCDTSPPLLPRARAGDPSRLRSWGRSPAGSTQPLSPTTLRLPGRLRLLPGAPTCRVPPAPAHPTSSPSQALGGTVTPAEGAGQATGVHGPLCATEAMALDPTRQAGDMEGPGGTAWHGMAWHSRVQYSMAWRGAVWHGTEQHGTAWHGVVWHGTARPRAAAARCARGGRAPAARGCAAVPAVLPVTLRHLRLPRGCAPHTLLPAPPGPAATGLASAQVGDLAGACAPAAGVVLH